MGYRVLLLDDDKAFHPYVRRLLEGAGHQVQACHCVGDALAMLRAGAFEVVLVDVCLGTTTAHDFRKQARGLAPSARWFAMSGGATREEVFGLVGAGYHDYFEKADADFTRLLAVLSNLDLSAPPESFNAVCAGMVGSVSVAEAQRQVRDAMTLSALREGKGNLTHAAKILGVTRQGMQWFRRQITWDEEP